MNWTAKWLLILLSALPFFANAVGTDLVKVEPKPFMTPAIQQYEMIKHLPRFPIGGRIDKVAQMNNIDPCNTREMMAALAPLKIQIPEDRLRVYVIRGCIEKQKAVNGAELEEVSAAGR